MSRPRQEDYLFYLGEKFQYEFKPMAERFFNFFYEGRKIIITSAYRKKGQKVDLRELARAISLKKDYEWRIQGGVYYEAQ